MSENEISTKLIFAKNLKKIMECKNLNTVDIAKHLKVSKQAVSSWCNGEKMPRMDKIERLSILFDVKKSELLEDNQSNNTNHTSKENEIIELFTKLPDKKKQLVIDLIINLSENNNNQLKKAAE